MLAIGRMLQCMPAGAAVARTVLGLAGKSASVLTKQQVHTPRNTKDDGQFKTWKPLAPTLRQRRMASRKDLHKGGPMRELTVAKRRTGGRNNTGRITCRHRGGGMKRRIRLVDFRRTEPGPQQVVRLEYDPGRTAHIALLKHMESGKLSYILAPAKLSPGAVVQSYMRVAFESQKAGASSSSDAATQEEAPASEAEAVARLFRPQADLSAELTSRVIVETGNCMPLKMIPIGTKIHNIGLHPFGRGQLARSAGASAQLLFTAPTGLAQIKLMSGEVRRIPVDACATIGQVSNSHHKHETLGSAGARRRRGWRPTVRGTAMNTHDHPHGGGRGKSKGNKHPRSPWGKLAKGGKTRLKVSSLVVRGRPRR
ncbi:mitochondrial 54S ribosomal protein rml2 [Coemansia aciculifera]|uniref:Mitochondrial 54S ribosomal protein rml2 n=1 Tax=Coemansia aciculifera TaxID=417176 RepID=A0ACC1M8X8_9FUNG|nr:mitochondrial 54S ribosomal protein rml2 [Coemansia aciculifera]KAJ2901036.1 mitochondrial 54S ribosomal protein rml2 [Coemansia aciculifera]